MRESIKMSYLDLLRTQFNNHFDLRVKRPDIVQLIVPLFHEDGDMVDIFLQEIDADTIRISDFGMTLMRLSYHFDIDTENKERIFQRILLENHLSESEGNIYLDIPTTNLYPGILQFAQGLAKAASLSLFKRETVRSIFKELLHEFVLESLQEYHPVFNHLPLPDREDLEVDILLTFNNRSFFLFPVIDSNSARLATISCLEFKRQKLLFTSCAVHEDFSTLPKKDMSRVTSAADKQFISLSNFKEEAEDFILREAA